MQNKVLDICKKLLINQYVTEYQYELIFNFVKNKNVFKLTDQKFPSIYSCRYRSLILLIEVKRFYLIK